MSENISVQILSQASDNIQKLFDLSTRIDERVKSVQSKQENLDKRIDDTINKHIDLMQKIAVLEAREEDGTSMYAKLDGHSKLIGEMDKRLSAIERSSTTTDERWKGVATFLIQLIWVILAAYVLTKLNLQAPAVP